MENKENHIDRDAAEASATPSAESSAALHSSECDAIEPHRFYATEELRAAGLGARAIETLRRHGLVSPFGRGYWGQNLIDAINQLCDTMAGERSLPVSRKEASSEIIDNTEAKTRQLRSRNTGRSQVQRMRNAAR